MTNLRGVLVWIGRETRRIVVTVVGVTLVVVGLALLVLPGPGILVIVAGFAVLATEYAWARRALREAQRRAGDATKRLPWRRKPIT